MFSENLNVQATLEITKLEDEVNTFCVDFKKKTGDLLSFFDLYKRIEKYIDVKLGYADESEELPNQ